MNTNMYQANKYAILSSLVRVMSCQYFAQSKALLGQITILEHSSWTNHITLHLFSSHRQTLMLAPVTSAKFILPSWNTHEDYIREMSFSQNLPLPSTKLLKMARNVVGKNFIRRNVSTKFNTIVFALHLKHAFTIKFSWKIEKNFQAYFHVSELT